MIVKGNRRGGAKQLADHILRRDNNEDVIIRELLDFPSKQLSDDHLRNALSLMAAQGQAKGKLRTLYHSILAPQEGETLDAKQLKYAVDTLAKNLGMEGHQRVIVEHRKAGRQHFHVVFNILHPETGKQARLQWTRKIEWNTSRQLEQGLNLKPVISKGRLQRPPGEAVGSRARQAFRHRPVTGQERSYGDISSQQDHQGIHHRLGQGRLCPNQRPEQQLCAGR